MTRVFAVAVLVVTTLCAGTSSADAGHIRVLASNGIKAALDALQPQLEKSTGDTLSIDFNTAATMRDRIEKGEAFDVAILTDEAMDAGSARVHRSLTCARRRASSRPCSARRPLPTRAMAPAVPPSTG